MPPKTKEKEAKPRTDSRALGITPEALLGYMQQQQFRKDDSWKPSIVNFQPNGAPVVQTQLAGSYSFNTVAPQYIAPGYEHLRDLSIKKDLEGQEQYSRWDKVRQSVGEADVSSLDPSYGQVMNGINTAMSDHDNNLRQGKWSENNGLISDFTNDIVKNKGLGDVMSTLSAVGEAKANFKAQGDEYDPKTQTGGISPEERAYYAANPGTFKQAQFDKNGNYIGGVGFTPATVYATRNIPKEIQDATDKIMASSVRGADGLYSLGDLAYQYGIDTHKRVTADQVADIVKSHIYGTGGKEYLDHKARVNVFNKYGDIDTTDPAVLEEVKRIATDMANEPNNPNSDMLRKIISKGDSFVAANAINILGAKETNDLNDTLLGGAVSRSAFDEISTQYLKDELGMSEYMERLKSSLKGEEEAKAPADVLYSLTAGSASILVKVDSTTPVAIREQEATWTARAAQLDKDLTAYKGDMGANSEESAKYRAMSIERAELERKLEDSKTYSKVVVQPYEKMVASSGKSLTQIASIYNQAVDKNMSTREFKLAFSRAVQLRIEGKDVGQAMAESGLKSSIDLTKIKPEFRRNFKGTYGSIVEGYGEDQKAIENQNVGNLANIVKNTADKWKKENPGNVNPEALYDAAIITGIEGDTEKSPGGRKYANYLASNKSMAQDVNNFIVSDSQAGSNKKLTIIDEIAEKTGVDVGFINGLLENKNLYAASIQTGNAKKEGRPMFFFKADIKEGNKDAESIEKVEKLKEAYPNGISIPVMLTPSVEKMNIESMRDATISLFKELKTTKQKPGIAFENTLNNIALGFGVSSNISSQIDGANLYGLSGRGFNATQLPNGLLSSQRAVTIDGQQLIITALDDPGAKDKWDKSFAVSLKKDGKVYEYYDNSVTGERALMTASDKDTQETPSQWVKHGFETDTDVKAFISRSYMDALIEKGSFNTGGGGQSGSRAFEGWKRAKSGTYKSKLISNGETELHTTYVPQDKLKSLVGSGVKMQSSVNLPYVHSDVYNNVINTMKANDLTLTGGLRTQEHQVKGSAENSKHYLGVTVDIADDAKGKAFVKKIKGNPKLQKELGISWYDVHDKGSGMHLHLEFMPQNSKITTKSSNKNINASANSVMNAIAGIESGGKNIGSHYKDKQANSSAFGKFGFTDYWFPKMATHYNLPVETVRARPDLIEEYAKTEYFNTAVNEINPVFSELKMKMRTFIPDFRIEDAVLMYHYAGGAYVKDIAKGIRSPNEIPRQDKGNKLSITKYIQERKKYM